MTHSEGPSTTGAPLYVGITADDGELYFVTAEDYVRETELRRICEERGVRYLSIRGVTHAPIPRETVVYETIRIGNARDYVSMCEAHPELVTLDIGGGRRPIHIASAFVQATAILEWLLTTHRGTVDIDARSTLSGRSPLDYAIACVNPVAVKMLLAHGASADHVDIPRLIPYIAELIDAVPPDAFAAVVRMINALPAHLRERCDPRWLRGERVTAAAGAPPPPPPEPVAVTCVVCMERPPDTLVLPCGHCVVCVECSKKLKTSDTVAHLCVYCKQKIEGIYLVADDAMQE